MRMEGRYTFAAKREVVWALLYDPLVLERVLPGCESFEAVAPNEYRITLFLRAGQISDRFVGTLHLDRIVPFSGFDFQADGESQNGLVNSRGRAYLEDESDGRTVLCYEADLYVGGRLTAVSGRLLQTSARAFARRCLEAMDEQVDMRTRIYTSTVAPEVVGQMTPASHTVQRLGQLRRFATLLSIVLALVFLLRFRDRRRTRSLAREVAALLQSSPAAVTAAESSPL